MLKRSIIIIIAVLLVIGVLGTTFQRVSSPAVSNTQTTLGSQLSDSFSSFDGQLSPDGPLAVSISAAGINQTNSMPPEIILSLVALGLLTLAAVKYQRNAIPIY